MSNVDHLEEKELEFEVEAILKHRLGKKRNKKYDPYYKDKFEYLIKWVGYSKPSWEPESCLDNCHEILNEYKKLAFSRNKKNKRVNKYNIYEKSHNNEANLFLPRSFIKASSKKIIPSIKCLLKDDSFIKEHKTKYNKRRKSPEYKIKKENILLDTDKGFSGNKEKTEEKKNNHNELHKEKINNINNNVTDCNNISVQNNYTFNKYSLSTECDCCSCCNDIIRGDKSIRSNNILMTEDFEDKKYCSKKRKRSDSLFSSNPIVKEDSKKEDLCIKIKTLENNSNSDTEATKTIKFIEINQIKVPLNNHENLSIVCKFNINGKIVDINGTRHLNLFPKEEILNYYEYIIKQYHKGKSFIFQ